MASLHFMPGARLRALQFILASPQTWWGRYYYPTYGLNSGLLCLLFGGGVLYPFNCDYNLLGWYCCYREFQWLIQGHMAIKWLSWDLNTAMYYSQELKIQIRQKHSCWIFNSWKYRQVKEKPQQSLIKFIFQASKVKLLLLLSRFSHVRLCATPETAAHQALVSLGAQ